MLARMTLCTRSLAVVAFILTLSGLHIEAFAAAAGQASVLIILADDLGWGDLSVNGNSNLHTPQLDSIARDGARFEHFYVQPVCAPTRAEFLTGRYHPRGGVRGVSTGAERLDLDEKTVADAFRAAGYATGCFGKWHNGSQYPYHPNGRGFEEYYGFTSGHWGEYFDPPLDHNGHDVRGEGYLADDLTGRAIDFMRASHTGGRPFFAYVAFNTPHSPMQVPDEIWTSFASVELKLRGTKRRLEEITHTRAALAMCENLDANVGRLLATIDQLEAGEDTIVLFFTDNGPNGHRWNDGMTGIKGSTDEGGVRSPLHVRWHGRIRSGLSITPIAAAIDLYPTLAAMTGVNVHGEKPLDGLDLSPLLFEESGGDVYLDRILLQHWNGQASARHQCFRLDAKSRLYDLTADPRQRDDVTERFPKEAKKLRAAVELWRNDVLAELPPQDDRPFPVGFGKNRTTTLPARDGQPNGNIQRSARAPNCSYFTNWTSPDDRMTWDVEVGNAGLYEAQIAYTCPPDAVGSRIELSLGDKRWTGEIDTPHDPPLRGRQRDRSPRRGESYVKDFKTLSLGVIELPSGRETLTLKAAEVPGNCVADVRHIRLLQRQ